jgi:hypothetical protein
LGSDGFDMIEPLQSFANCHPRFADAVRTVDFDAQRAVEDLRLERVRY